MTEDDKYKWEVGRKKQTNKERKKRKSWCLCDIQIMEECIHRSLRVIVGSHHDGQFVTWRSRMELTIWFRHHSLHTWQRYTSFLWIYFAEMYQMLQMKETVKKLQRTVNKRRSFSLRDGHGVTTRHRKKLVGYVKKNIWALKENGENYMMRHFITCTLHPILSSWLKQRGRFGRGIGVHNFGR